MHYVDISKHDTRNASNNPVICRFASWYVWYATDVLFQWRRLYRWDWDQNLPASLLRADVYVDKQPLCCISICANSQVTVWSLNYQITPSNWTIWFPRGLGLALSQKFFLPCTIWWDKCNGISVLVCAWVVSVAFLMMLRLSQNKWKYLSDAPWKERWGKKQSSHWASEFSHKGHPTLQRSMQANHAAFAVHPVWA